ncbi:MAG: DUF4091 domain-containing protein [Deltaproteobacteria bacterium]|nr:DUF4091 domain-containing protein [Deltaproteobacteria bacterium]
MLASLLLFSPGPARAWEVGVAPSTRKVMPDSPVPGSSRVELWAARGEWEAFQIVLRDAAGASEIDVELDDLCLESGEACIPASSARLYRELFVEVIHPSPFGVTLHERAAGSYPDPLIPFADPYSQEPMPAGAPFDLEPGEVGAIFADWKIPPGAQAGSYAGAARVSAAGGKSALIEIRLQVWDFAIPAQPSVATAFGHSTGSIRAFHGGPEGDPAPGYEAIADRYFEILHVHRIDPLTIRGPVEFLFDESGELEPVDWTAYDESVGPWLDGSRFEDGIGVTRFNLGLFGPGRGTGEMSVDGYIQAAAAMAAHLKDRGWWERAWTYAIDEPWGNDDPDSAYARIAADSALLVQADEEWKDRVLVTSPYDERIDSAAGIWCPVTPMFDDWFFFWEPEADRTFYAERAERGEELWFYVCNANLPPYAGYDIDTRSGFEPRVVKWGAWYEGATGFLYWRATFWVDSDPWNVFLDLERFGEFAARNGDGMLLYPGDHDGTAAPRGSPDWLSIDGPIPSYRLKQVRDGLEDWEILRLAESLGAGDFARQQVERVYTRFGDFFMENCDDPVMYCPDDQPWTLDEQVLLDARRAVADRIVEILHAEPDKPEEPGGCGCGTSSAGEIWLALLALLGPAACGRLSLKYDC